MWRNSDEQEIGEQKEAVEITKEESEAMKMRNGNSQR